MRRVTWSQKAWVVETGLPVSELSCARLPATTIPDPVASAAQLSSVAGVLPFELLAPPCQSVSFNVVGSGDLDMFEKLPEISAGGTLVYQLAANAWGVASFAGRALIEP